MKYPMAYYKLVALPDEVKAKHGIRSKARLDCILSNDESLRDGYKGLEPIYSHKGQFYLYLTSSGHFVNADSRRKPEWSLTQSGYNLTSIYLEDFDFPQFGYGYPYSERFMGNGAENPLYPIRNDAFLILLSKDRSEIELLIVPDSRNMISSYYHLLLDGELDDEISQLRAGAKSFYEYGYSKKS
jgi:hypothetical protein